MKKILCSIVLCLFLFGCGTAQKKISNDSKKIFQEDSASKISTDNVRESFDEIFRDIKKASEPLEHVLPQHIKKIAIRPFKNNTPNLGLEDRLYIKLYDEFLHDTKYTLVNNENDADGVVVGEITHYILIPLVWGASFEVEQYKLRILVNLYFLDRIENKVLWEEKGFEGMHMYYTTVVPGGITEEEAREIVWEQLSHKIYRRVTEGFGAESGITEKKIPK